MSALVALGIDFQRGRGGRRSWVGWLVLLLGTMTLIAVIVESMQLQRGISAEKASAVAAHPAAAANGEAVDAATAEALKGARNVAARLAVPWASLFAELEAAANADIALLGMQADASAHMLRVNGEARDFPALMDYVRRLEASAVLADVRLTGHAVRQQDPQRPVAFTLAAAWGRQP